MEARIAVLEEIAKSTKEAVAEIRADLRGMRADLSAVRTELSFVRGKIDSLPTTWQLIGTVIGGNVTLAGLVLAAIKLFGH